MLKKNLNLQFEYFYFIEMKQILNNKQGECAETSQQDYCNLTIVGYRSTRSRDLKAKLDPFEYILSMQAFLLNWLKNIKIYHFF